MAEIPKVKIAVLGGSTTIGANFPRAYKGVNVIADGLVFETPFGPTAPFTHAEVDGKEFQIKWSAPASEAILGALRVMDPDDDSCGCHTDRWKSILL